MFTSDDRYGFEDSQKFDIAQYTRPRGRLVKKLGYTTGKLIEKISFCICIMKNMRVKQWCVKQVWLW